MTLEQATCAVLAAIEAEDLGALEQALEVRAAAIQATPTPSREAVEAGERAYSLLQGLIQRWAAEDARLGQIQAAFGRPSTEEDAGVVLHG
jgi:hypothetical protein